MRPRATTRTRAKLVSFASQYSADLVRGRHGCVELAESGDERCVYVLRVHLASAELEVGSGAGVGNERHLEAEVGAGARGRVDAHAGHHPGHDDLLDVEAVQRLLEVGA